MKKLLLASTALVLSAGVAAADVALSGDARMGLLYNGDDVQLTSRARVIFTLSGETDSGLAFGGSFRADNAGGAANGSAGSVFISGDFGKLSMGDVDSAAMAATGDLFAVGLTGLGDRHEMQYVGRLVNGLDGTLGLVAGLPITATLLTDGMGDPVLDAQLTGIRTGLTPFPRALYEYSIDGFSVYASIAYSKTNSIGLTGRLVERVTGANISIPLSASVPVSATLTEGSVGASYEIDGFMIAAGYEQARLKVDGDSIKLGHATVAAGYAMDGLEAKVIVGSAMNDLRDIVETRTQYGVGVKGTFDATTVSAFARRDFFKVNHYGVGASYDLGGGASIKGGVAKSQGSSAVADFGLAFTF